MNLRNTGTILDEITAQKVVRLALQKEKVSIERMIERAQASPEPRDFARAIGKVKNISLIAEIKKASPSKGLLRESFEPTELANAYEKAGASAISVITEEDFFLGSPDYLTAARRATGLPLLRKDFVFDRYQVYEARMLGADAVLLIVSILEPDALARIIDLCIELKITPLVEAHDEKEIQEALSAGASIIGINNRNLKSMRVDKSTAQRLYCKIPENALKIVESGVDSREDMVLFEETGYDAVLVGSSIVIAPDVEKKIQELLGGD